MKTFSPPVLRSLAGFALSLLTIANASNAATWSKATTGTWNWADGANWNGGVAPGNSVTENVYFAIAATNQTVLLNGGSDVVLKGGLSIYGSSASPGKLTLDLQTRRLIIDGGTLTLNADSAGTGTLSGFSNGTVQLGTTNNAASLTLGIAGATNNNSNFTMQFAAGSTLDTANTTNISVATTEDNRSKNYTLDLSAATLRSGSLANTLAVSGTISLGQSTSNNATADRNRNGVLKLGVLSTLSTGADLIVAQNQRSAAGNGPFMEVGGKLEFSAATTDPVTMNIGRDLRIGVGDRATGTIASAPSVLNVNISSAATLEAARGVLYVGYKNQSQGTTSPDGVTSGSFVAGAGDGDFNAYLKEFRVGQNTRTAGSATGVLDFRNSTSILLEISGDAVIGAGIGGKGSVYFGGGTASSSNLIVGDATSAQKSVLSLGTTIWSVSSGLKVGILGEIDLVVGGTSGGIDIASNNPVNFTIDAGGIIDVRFDAGGGIDRLWGIRMLGDQRSLFNSYVTEDRIIASGMYGSEAVVFYDNVYTYYGIAAIPEPSSLALLALAGGVGGWMRRSLMRRRN